MKSAEVNTFFNIRPWVVEFGKFTSPTEKPCPQHHWIYHQNVLYSIYFQIKTMFIKIIWNLDDHLNEGEIIFFYYYLFKYVLSYIQYFSAYLVLHPLIKSFLNNLITCFQIQKIQFLLINFNVHIDQSQPLKSTQRKVFFFIFYHNGRKPVGDGIYFFKNKF